MVMHRDNGIAATFRHGSDGIIDSFLHLRVGPLHSVQLNSPCIFTCCNRRHCSSAHADAVIITSHKQNCIIIARNLFQAVFFLGIANTACLHNHFIIAVSSFFICIFKSAQRAANDWLAEFISEVRSSIRSFDKNLLRSLVKPFARRFFPRAWILLKARIAGHIDCSASDWEGTFSACHTVANLTACASCRTIKRLDSGRKVVSLCFQRNDCLFIISCIKRWLAATLRMKKIQLWAFNKGAIVFICRNYFTRIGLSCLLDKLEE